MNRRTAAALGQQAGLALIIRADFTRALISDTGQGRLTLIHDPTLTIRPRIVPDLLRLFMDSVAGFQNIIVVQKQARRG